MNPIRSVEKVVKVTVWYCGRCGCSTEHKSRHAAAVCKKGTIGKKASREEIKTRNLEMVRLREEEGWSYQQIADAYGLKKSYVNSLIRGEVSYRKVREDFDKGLIKLPSLNRI